MGLADLRAAILIAAMWALLANGAARAQDMEPRAYSAAPIHTNFAVASYQRITGSVALDPSVPITGLEGSINAGFLAYDRTFDLFGHMASAALAVPYFNAEFSGEVVGVGQQVTRAGLGDMRLRFTQNLIGNPSLLPEQFAEREPQLTLGTSLTVIAPTGDYNSAHLINISSNRWGFKPELGLSQPIGDWFVDAAAGAWFFTDNPDFFGGHRRGAAPLMVAQAHLGYNFKPGLWLAADGVYYSGGETSIDGVQSHDAQTVSRFGATLSVPLIDGLSAKFAWATWLTAHNGGKFDTIGITLQYRWFDP